MPHHRDAPSLKLIQGSKPSAYHPPEPRPQDVEPDEPVGLPARTREIWDHVTEELRAMGCLYRADQFEILNYVQTVALAEKTWGKIMKAPVTQRSAAGGMTVHPLLSFALTLSRTSATLARHMGLNPGGRTLIHGLTRNGRANTEAGNAEYVGGQALFG